MTSVAALQEWEDIVLIRGDILNGVDLAKFSNALAGCKKCVGKPTEYTGVPMGLGKLIAM